MNTKDLEKISKSSKRPAGAIYYNIQSELFYRKRYGKIQYFCKHVDGEMDGGSWMLSRCKTFDMPTFFKLI